MGARARDRDGRGSVGVRREQLTDATRAESLQLLAFAIISIIRRVRRVGIGHGHHHQSMLVERDVR